MKSFCLDETGDILIKNNRIEMIDGANLTAQKVRCVLATNKGEWFANKDEGISFDGVFGKNRVAVKQSNQRQKSGDLSEAQELAIAARLQNRLDGDS